MARNSDLADISSENRFHYLIVHPAADMLTYPPAVYGQGLLLAVPGTVVPALLMSVGLKRAGPQRFAVMGARGPVATLFLAWAILQEQPNALQALGLTFALAGGLGIAFLIDKTQNGSESPGKGEDRKIRVEPSTPSRKPFPLMQQQAIKLEEISIYGGTQTRAATNDEAIVHYAEEMEAGVEFPPITAFFDGSKYWLADGFHRYLAAKRNEYATISADVREGGRSDALEHALGANATNGLFRTAADKRHAVEVSLEEWPDRSNPVLAEICKVSVEFVRKQRQKSPVPPPASVTGKDGKQYPSRIERQPRGGGGGGEDGGEGGGSSGGGKPGKKSAAAEMAFGGSSKDLEMEAIAMERNGEISFMRPGDPLPASAGGLARMAIAALDRIGKNDPEREQAFRTVFDWLAPRLGPGAEDENSVPAASGPLGQT